MYVLINTAKIKDLLYKNKRTFQKHKKHKIPSPKTPLPRLIEVEAGRE